MGCCAFGCRNYNIPGGGRTFQRLPVDPALAQPPTKGPLPLIHRWTFSDLTPSFTFHQFLTYNL